MQTQTSQSSDAAPIVVHGTEVRFTETRQQYREKIARITLDAMVQFVGLLDARGTVLEINKVALDAVGITLADVEGRSFWDTFWWQVSPEINQGIRDYIARAAAGEFVRWDTEIFGRAGGKETIVIDASLMPVFDEAGTVVFICADGRDITEKKAQERLIAQQNVELQGLLERIRELDEIKTQFFANVSHELRTPLTLILGPAQRLIDDVGAMSDTERRDSADVIARNARMLLKHVNDLLDMSRIEAGKLKIELQPTDVAALVRFLASHFDVLAADRGVGYEVRAQGAVLAAVDADKLQRVLMNLLANAFKFVPAGGRVRVALESADDTIVATVDDSGPGVKPELRSAIFERFRQADGGSNRKVGGTGLGLAIAKEFVEMHRGRIEVGDSDLGGARFSVTLPKSLVDGAASPGAIESTSANRDTLAGLIEELRPAREVAPPATALANRARVLVVEDNADMNRFIAQSLAREFDVVSALDGREGLEKAIATTPALIISDVMMPSVSGVEMIAELRKVPALRDVPVLFLSAKADDQLRVRLLEEGAHDFIVKPFLESDLLARVRKVVQARDVHHAEVRARKEVEQALTVAQEARAEAERANRVKSQFLASMSHELRTPLNAIQGHVQLLEMGLRGPVTPEQRETLERVQRSQRALQSLINDVLNFARLEAGRVEYHTKSVLVGALVTDVLQMIDPQLATKRLTARADIAPDVCVSADPEKLQQILLNLLSNAIKFTLPGGRITIDTGHRAELSRGLVMLRVADTGVGIARAKQESIFDPFVQVQHEHAVSTGIGLGLAISRDLARGMGGDLRVRSTEGEGSVFTLTLPRG
jgi:PAS domain S-box-containing protein